MIDDLYQELIIDHGTEPRNFNILSECSHKASGNNPLCGDQLEVFLKVSGNIIEDISFKGTGCAISMASSSIMTEELKGKTIEEAMALFNGFVQTLTTEQSPESLPIKIQALTGVRKYPMRVKCATLAWHTLKSAYYDNNGTATTE